MKNVSNKKIIIIGAGLTGLAIAYYLRQSDLDIKILEARSRTGGRIFTKRAVSIAPIELGATWLGKAHTELIGLLKELNIEIFEQKFGDRAIYEPISTSPPQLVRLPPNNDPSFRIKGGTDRIIQALESALDSGQIETAQEVKSIIKTNDRILVETQDRTYDASTVISTLPPHLFVNNINVTPELPAQLVELANNTHTWMGDSIKIALSFEESFWEDEQLSGTIFSSVGPIPEMYEHSNFEETRYALKGFLNGAFFELSKEERLDHVLNQLKKYYGQRVLEYTQYEELVWTNEKYTSSRYTQHVIPHQNNGHQIYQRAYLDDRLYLAGTETSREFYGYMEGAVRSAQDICNRIGTAFKN